MAIDITALEAEVSRATTVGDSIKVLVERLAAGAGVPQEKIDAMVAALDANNDSIEAKVLEHTPQDPDA